MNKLYLFMCTLTLALLAFPVYAEQNNGQNTVEVKVTQRAEKRAEITANVTTRLKEKAYKEIDRRIASLSKLIEKIRAVKRLTESQKSTMASQVQAEIDSLTALRATIAGQTDIATIRTSVQSIVKSYRIYVLYIPKMTIIANADKILNLIEGEIATLTTKLQLRIDEAKSNGYAVETMTSLMTQRKVKLESATTQANGAIAKVTPLTPDGWPGNKTELQAAREMLKVARKDINDAQKLANQVRVELKATKPRPTATP